MLLPFWPSLVLKYKKPLMPGDISGETLDTNILCYGREISNTTEAVLYPVVSRALEKRRSCIIYAQNASKKYAQYKRMAVQLGYKIKDIDISELSEEDADALEKRMETYWNKGTSFFFVFSNREHFRELAQHTVVDRLICKLAHLEDRPELNNVYSCRDARTLIVVDGACGNILIPSIIKLFLNIQFCIMVSSDLLNESWRKRVFNTFYQKGLLPAEFLAITASFPQLDFEKLGITAYLSFFQGVETVICTRVNGISPAEHKKFISQYILPKYCTGPRFASGGIYVVKDLPTKADYDACAYAAPSLNADPNNIETSVFESVAQTHIVPGMYLLYVNGNSFLAGGRKTNIMPLCFFEKEEGDIWVQMYFRRERSFCFVRKENINGDCRYVYTNTETGIEENILLRLITENNQDECKIDFFLRLYTLAETVDFEMWLQRDPAVTKELAAAEDDTTLPEEESSEAEEQLELCVSSKAANALPSLPDEGVLFLGGHQNMTKKLWNKHPKWLFITDDNFRSKNLKGIKYVFYWTNHSSHAMMEYVLSRITPEAKVMYVTATNIALLEQQMKEAILAVSPA